MLDPQPYFWWLVSASAIVIVAIKLAERFQGYRYCAGCRMLRGSYIRKFSVLFVSGKKGAYYVCKREMRCRHCGCLVACTKYVREDVQVLKEKGRVAA